MTATATEGQVKGKAIKKKPRKKTAKKDPNKRGECKQSVGWISDKINLTTLYRIKGAPGLWVPRTAPNKSKLLQMKRYLRKQTCTVNLSSLQQLNNALIYTKDGEAVPLPWALDNLQEHYESQTTGDLYADDKEKLMEIIYPNYDPKHFKDHHAMKIIKWYNELIYSLNEYEKNEKDS